MPGCGRASPRSAAAIFSAPLYRSITPTANRARPMKAVASVSYLPWP